MRVLMQVKNQNSKEWRRARRKRQLGQAVLVSLAVAGLISLVLWAQLFTSRLAGLFTLMQVRAADYLYETKGDPGDDHKDTTTNS